MYGELGSHYLLSRFQFDLACQTIQECIRDERSENIIRVTALYHGSYWRRLTAVCTQGDAPPLTGDSPMPHSTASRSSALFALLGRLQVHCCANSRFHIRQFDY